ncbi:MAG: glucose 1-dehydrogenase [Chloroflexi bacterium]|nr:glucose 1-dehydrogenase [Chloroflexota bacterium]MCC6893870.1 glucose 1-dehydrogenase [Anaerolineae bacterium]
MSMEGKVAVVTGGGNGIGQAACIAFAREGAKVVVVDIDRAACEQTAAAISETGGVAHAFMADVSQSGDVQSYVKYTVDTFGRIDAFFNNAGIEGVVSPLVEYDEANWDRVIGINLKGTFLGLRYVLPVMIAQKKGAVVNTASVAGTVGAPNMAAYSASKHAIIGLTRTAAGEVGKHSVRVNAVCPGPIKTRMMQSLESMINPAEPTAVAKANVARNPMGRYGEAEEVARVVVFLASDEADYVNGAAWLIDGGRTAI